MNPQGKKKNNLYPFCRPGCEPPPFSYSTDHSRPPPHELSTKLLFSTFQLLFIFFFQNFPKTSQVGRTFLATPTHFYTKNQKMASLAGKTGKSKALEEWRAQRTRGEYSMEVSLLYSALRSFKKTSVVNPFPKDFVVAGVRDYGRVTQAICRLPSAAVVYGDASALPTVSVDEEKLLAFMLENANLKEISDMDEVMRHVPGHDPVYIPQRAFAVQHDAQRNKEFEAAAEQYPPKVAFHGSPIGNWFSIGKTGLRNLNGLHKPAHGSLFGEGIYMSKTLRLASDFSSSGDSWGLSDVCFLAWFSMRGGEKPLFFLRIL